MKSILSVTMALFLFFSAYSLKAQSSDAPQHKVVIQLVNGDSLSQRGLMKNLKNLTAGWPDLQIEVVCHGPGISLLHTKKSLFLDEVQQFKTKGVDFVACENTMKSKHIDRKMITEDARTVPMGLKEVILKQEAGWSYIKAGVVKN